MPTLPGVETEVQAVVGNYPQNAPAGSTQCICIVLGGGGGVDCVLRVQYGVGFENRWGHD